MKKSPNDRDGKSRPTRLRMSRVISTAIDSLQHAFETRKVKLTHRRSESIHFVLSEKEKLYQVVRNLLHHALDLASAGGEIRITESKLTGRRRADKADLIKVSIAVGGNGISEDMLEVLNSKFQQISDLLMGSGDESETLKLSVCKEFIRNTGGNIWVKNQPGKSLNFNFTLPLIKEIKLKTRKRSSAERDVRVVGAETVTVLQPPVQIAKNV